MSWVPKLFLLLQATPRGTFGYSTRQYSVSDHFYTARSVIPYVAHTSELPGLFGLFGTLNCPFVKQIYLLLEFLSFNLFRYWQASEKL